MILLLRIFVLIVAINQIQCQCLHNIMWVMAFKNEDEFNEIENQNSNVVRLDNVEQQQYEVIKIERNKELDKICTELMGEMKRIKHIIVNETAVREIDAGAFHQAYQLETIEFIGNHIRHIRYGIFNNLTNLNVLHLPLNNIQKIDENAFDNLPELTEIDLSVNDIKSINPNWFKGCIKLRMIDLADNALTTIPYFAFQYLNPYLTINIDLQSNKLRNIEAGAFGNIPKIGVLQLRRNNIREIPDMFGNDLEEAHKLGLNKNKISCIPDVVLQKLNKFDEIRINRNPINHNCILRHPQFLMQNKNKYYVEGVLEDVNLKKKLRPFTRRQ